MVRLGELGHGAARGDWNHPMDGGNRLVGAVGYHRGRRYPGELSRTGCSRPKKNSWRSSRRHGPG
jgi:hypothetical protein